MRIAIIGANGAAGKLLTQEAVARGHEVMAVTRSENETEAPVSLRRDIFDIERGDIAGVDAMVDTLTPNADAGKDFPERAAHHLIELVSGLPTRLIVLDNGDAKVPTALEGAHIAKWTYISPEITSADLAAAVIEELERGPLTAHIRQHLVVGEK
ncbi:NAD(P)-dependent oxidoreductase [Actinotignum sp. GS-2025b]|uniref:NAD(P)-dependent oxidoreductase n=1 Tax=Actinotignum sp. GS-2025b TaxID=3427275 RepID=UPI003F45319D